MDKHFLIDCRELMRSSSQYHVWSLSLWIAFGYSMRRESESWVPGGEARLAHKNPTGYAAAASIASISSGSSDVSICSSIVSSLISFFFSFNFSILNFKSIWQPRIWIDLDLVFFLFKEEMNAPKFYVSI